MELLDLKQIGAFLVEDLTTSWKYILIALAFAAIASVNEMHTRRTRREMVFFYKHSSSFGLY